MYFVETFTTLSKAMKKTLKKTARSNPSLGDLILAVSSVSRNNREAVAAVADLLESGRVCLNSNGRKVRARVC
jgi:glycerol-3-phosphate dehydrogenase